ncbi:MAG: hypothetical protein GY760_07200 [Deltaproteobacteria bacterium]|nr:hypothetical protein [Deltaproteobacteria bacterium]
MRGADEYCSVFRKTEQFGKILIVPSSHARGCTFSIYILADGIKYDSEKCNTPHYRDESVEVYGMLGGQRGWTEYYGWIHKGKWCEDFEDIYKKRKSKIEQDNINRLERIKEKEKEEKELKKSLLDNY